MANKYKNAPLGDIIRDKRGLTAFLAELANECQRTADDDLERPDTEIGKSYRQFWLTAAAEIEMLRVRLDG
ncbi:hypothetical protein A6S26_05515 [Nostoc sp. ATCC 43529]|nr:hypothetical protein A6S26_05515 [Nostoc sp. ATCC 43529]